MAILWCVKPACIGWLYLAPKMLLLTRWEVGCTCLVTLPRWLRRYGVCIFTSLVASVIMISAINFIAAYARLTWACG